jgi:cephalosporin hydroxylase
MKTWKLDIKDKVMKAVENYYHSALEIPLSEHPAYTFKIAQDIEEIIQVVQYLNGRKFNSFVEIGSCVGGSAWLYSELLCSKNANVTLIDVDSRRELFFIAEKIRKTGKNVKIISKSSSDVEVTNEIIIPIDLLHIDGDHKYEAVKRDWDKFQPYVIKNGIIILHDTNSTTLPEIDKGAEKLVKELNGETDYKITTFSNTCGISVIEK